MTTEQAKKAGREHAEAVKKCTPYDCQKIDALLFAAAKKQTGQQKNTRDLGELLIKDGRKNIVRWF